MCLDAFTEYGAPYSKKKQQYMCCLISLSHTRSHESKRYNSVNVDELASDALTVDSVCFTKNGVCIIQS